MSGGDTAARSRFTRLFDENYEHVYRFALRRCGDPTAAEDVASDVFLAAWRHIAVLPAEPLTWLYGTARGVLANRRRGAQRSDALEKKIRNELAVEAQPGEPTGPDKILHALARLPDEEREVLLLVAWEGLDRQQAAEVLGCSCAAFATRLHRARRRLESEMAVRRPPEGISATTVRETA